MKSQRIPPGVPPTESLELLQASFSRAYPVAEMTPLDELLTAIDEADDATVHDKRPKP